MEVVMEKSAHAPENVTTKAREEIVSVEIREYKARQERLLMLVGELLRTNEDLRQKVARLEAQGARA
jgi:hypothetical protein